MVEGREKYNRETIEFEQLRMRNYVSERMKQSIYNHLREFLLEKDAINFRFSTLSNLPIDAAETIETLIGRSPFA